MQTQAGVKPPILATVVEFLIIRGAIHLGTVVVGAFQMILEIRTCVEASLALT